MSSNAPRSHRTTPGSARFSLAGLAVLCIGLLLGGCAFTPRDSFTAGDQEGATLQGYNGIRIWADAPAKDIARLIMSPALLPSRSHEVNYLALSGGGAGGAFGAGLLKGWSETGRRPAFDLVTGVSTGALIAPFAFLGSDYDDVLRSLYTGAGASSLGKADLGAILSGSSLLDPQPLRAMVERYATADLLGRIAEQHRAGRRLLVVTTNLDAQRPVLWDMGAIAASGRPESLALFRDILVASASIPAVYPPVMIDVRGAGAPFAEMHVDGGTAMQVFSLPDILFASRPAVPLALRRKIHLWVVVNNTLPAEFAVTGSAIVPIALRSFSTLMKSQTKGIVSAAAEASTRLGIDFNLAYIDRAVDYDPRKPFQSAYMDTVFALGEREMQQGTLWRKSLDALAETASR